MKETLKIYISTFKRSGAGENTSSLLHSRPRPPSNGHIMSYRGFKKKFACKTNFLQFYQVVSTIPKHLVTKAKNTVPPESELCIENSPLFQLDNLTAILSGKVKTRDFYCSFNGKIHSRCQTGPTKWSQTIHLDGEAWKEIFTSLKIICKETKLKEFQFHRGLFQRGLFRYGIKTDGQCLYCGEHDSIDHTFNDCEFVKYFVKNLID